MSVKEFLKQQAVNIAVGGQYTLSNWFDAQGKPRTFACRTSRVSPLRMLVAVPVVGKVGDHITSYFGDFGKLEGEISDTIAAALSKLIETFGHQRDPNVQSNDLSGTTIRLDSPGGSVSAAMEVGRLLRMNRMTAFVDPYASCLSACVLIYAGAVARFGYNE